MDGMTLTDLFSQMREERRRIRAQRTIEEYEIFIRQLSAYLERPATIADLNKQTGNAYLTWLSKEPFAGRPRQPSTINKRLATFRAMWQFAQEEEFVPMKPMRLERFVTDKVPPVTWTLDDLNRMFAIAKQLPGRVGEIKAKHFWRALLLTCYDTAARITPILLLQVTDFNVKARTLRFDAANQKQHAEQTIRISKQTAKAIKKMDRAQGRLFPWTADPDRRWGSLRRHFREFILKPAELPFDRKHSFHCFRRTNATALAVKVDDETAARQLGHSSTAITRKHYVDDRQRPVVQAADVLDRPKV